MNSLKYVEYRFYVSEDTNYDSGTVTRDRHREITEQFDQLAVQDKTYNFVKL